MLKILNALLHNLNMSRVIHTLSKNSCATLKWTRKDTKMTCLHCFLIPRFFPVLKCGHVSCHRFFLEWFKRTREPKCNYCRAPVVLEEVMTLHDDRLKRPGSLTANMYDVAIITCTNIGCTKEFNIDQKTITSSMTAHYEL